MAKQTAYDVWRQAQKVAKNYNIDRKARLMAIAGILSFYPSTESFCDHISHWANSNDEARMRILLNRIVKLQSFLTHQRKHKEDWNEFVIDVCETWPNDAVWDDVDPPDNQIVVATPVPTGEQV